MLPPAWLPAFPQTPRRPWGGGPQDSRARFDPEVGPPLMRGRTTADPEVYDTMFPNFSGALRAAFKVFWINDLARGALAFSWRDPVIGDAALWKILGNGDQAYGFSAKGADLHELSLRLMRLPGTPWWGTYLRPGANRVPDVVADWTAGVHGIAGAKVAASALPAVTGTFDVYSTSTSDVETVLLAQVITAGGIPATAPALVKRRVYFAS